MTVTFPPPPPSLSDQVLAINRFLASPTLVQRALVALTKERFIADAIFTGRVRSAGGAVLYEQTESIYPERDPEEVAPGAEFPKTETGQGPAKLDKVQRWGSETDVTDQAIIRLQRNPVDRALTKLANGTIRKVDRAALAVLAADPAVQTLAGADWSLANATIIRQLFTAVAMINDLNQGYQADTVVFNDFALVDVMDNEAIRQAMRRETETTPIYIGHLTGPIAGLDPFITNNGPDGTSAWVLDRKVLGSMVEEEPLSSLPIRDQKLHKWILQSWRVARAIVQEPKACVRVTGVQAA